MVFIIGGRLAEELPSVVVWLCAATWKQNPCLTMFLPDLPAVVRLASCSAVKLSSLKATVPKSIQSKQRLICQENLDWCRMGHVGPRFWKARL